MKLRAPFAAVYYAWSPTAEVEAWLKASDPPPMPQQRASFWDGIAFTRKHGFTVFVRNPYVRAAQEPPEQTFGAERAEFPAAVVAELKSKQEYALAAITAPVFDGQGRVAFALGLTGFVGPASGAEIERMGRRLRDACDRVTTFIAGRQPEALAAVL